MHVKAGGSTEVEFSVSALALVFAAPNGDLVSSPGEYTLTFDDGSGEEEPHGSVSTSLTVTGARAAVLEKFPAPTPPPPAVHP